MEQLSKTADGEIIISRVLNAPRNLVFEVWTNPEHIAKWWGPNGFTNTIYKMEVKRGGEWNFMMHGPDGTDYLNRIVFKEVIKPERLVYVHDSGVEDDPMGFDVTVTFVEKGNQTQLTMHSVFKTAEAVAAVKKFGAVEGGKQTINRLEEYLKLMQS